ncbi:MAG: hypothetical protein AB7O68_16860 [Pirellulales bacterium]
MATIWNRSLLGIVAAYVIGAVTTSGLTATIISRNVTSVPLPQSSTSTATKIGNVVLSLPFVAKATATGSATVKTTGMDGKAGTKYAAICLPNPLFNVGYGSGGTTVGRNSGSILELVYHNVRNPAAIGGDIGFVRDCNSDGTGSTLINDTCTASGCTSIFALSGNNGDWSGFQFVKLGLRGNPTSSYEAYITGRVRDIIGE